MSPSDRTVTRLRHAAFARSGPSARKANDTSLCGFPKVGGNCQADRFKEQWSLCSAVRNAGRSYGATSHQRKAIAHGRSRRSRRDRLRGDGLPTRPRSRSKRARFSGHGISGRLRLSRNECRQLRVVNFALTGLVTLPLRAISPRESCRPAFEQHPFRAYPGLVLGLAFERSELSSCRPLTDPPT
jgi:hypothetical protein